MLPSSHVVPINAATARRLEDPRALADAFSEFMAASVQLEGSYRDLQQEVSRLSVELADRNAALTRSLLENKGMRAALQQMLDSMPCGVLVLDTREMIVMINPEGRRLLRLQDDSVTRTLSDLSKLTNIDFVTLGGSTPDRVDSEICVAMGDAKRWLAMGKREIGGGAMRDSSTPSLRSIWILRDVTADKEAELAREAARRTTTLAEISAILAHEIRNPLASMELFAGLLAEDSAGKDEWISHLRAGIRTLSGTVNNVLSMNGEHAPRLTRLDLTAAIRGAVEFVRPIAEQASVNLRLALDEQPLFIEGNEDALRQIVLNLVRNAIRHTPSGGDVLVTVRLDLSSIPCMACVEVKDTGAGIAPEHIEQIFAPGFSGTGETPGIGLAVCQRLVTQHSGSISVSSRQGEGARFQMGFPAL